MHALVLAFFFVSGLCGLLYEIAWIRAAGTVLGNTSHAVGTVVGVFMGGLALGGFWGGRLADRASGSLLLRRYAELEFGIAASALLVPLLLAAGAPVFSALWTFTGGGGPLYATARVLLVGLVLLPPTTLMGATLPVLARWLSAAPEAGGGHAGRAYAVNTFGGVAGTFVAGFWLVPALGIRWTIGLAVLLNAAVAVAALGLARRDGRSSTAAPRPAPLPVPWRAASIAALSGLAGLAYEIAWTRGLVLALGSTVHAITLILSIFILGLAGGAAMAAKAVDRIRDPRRMIAAGQAAAALLALLLLPWLGRLPLDVARDMGELKGDYTAVLWMQSKYILLIVLGPALCLGALFPFAVKLAASTSEGRLGHSVGAVYTANTLGSIAGSLLATFLLVPFLGIAGTVKVAAVANAAAAGLAIGRGLPGFLPLAATGLLALLLPAWNPKIAASGAFMYGSADLRSAERLGQDLGRYLEEDTELLAEYRDSYGLTTIHRQRDGILTMRVNGKADASTGRSDRANMLYVGHVPLLQHPDPRRALCIGLGAGLTLAAMAEHPLDRIDCVEISPAVRRGAEHFAEAAGGVLSDPRVRLIMGDGRNALAFGRHSYDVIISQPSNLWVSGMANLFTADFFREAAARLSPGGVMGQWIHAYWLAESDFRALIRTFYSVFPEGWIWEIFPGHDYLLVGSSATPAMDPELLSPRLRALKSFQELAADPGMLFGALLAEAGAARRAAGPGPVVTDDHCFLEYTAPRSLGRDTRPEILAWLEPLRAEGRGLPPASALPRERRAAMAAAVRRHGADPQGALRGLPKEAAGDARSHLFIVHLAEIVFDAGHAAIRRGDPRAAAEAFESIPSAAAAYADARLNLGELAFQSNRQAEARRFFGEALAGKPASAEAAAGVARTWQAAKEYEEALRAWALVAELRPGRPAPYVQRALCLWRLDRTAEAIQECRKALALDPDDLRAKELLQELEKR